MNNVLRLSRGSNRNRLGENFVGILSDSHHEECGREGTNDDSRVAE